MVAIVVFPTVLAIMEKFPAGFETQIVPLAKRFKFVQSGLMLVFHESSCTGEIPKVAAIPVQVSFVLTT